MNEHLLAEKEFLLAIAPVTFTPDDTARMLLACIEHFREQYGPDLPIQRLSVLLTVATNPQIQQLDIAKIVNASESSVSRHVMDMTYLTRSQEPGPELLVQRQDPAFRRRNLVDLGPKGQNLIDQFAALATNAYNNAAAARR